MKWAVIILVLLGVLAALSASVLVSTLRADSLNRANAPSGVEVVLAKRSVPAMSVVTSFLVTKDTVARDKPPAGYLSSPVQAVGRVLAVPVVEGQILTESCFVTEGTGAQLAAALPEGMRAISIPLSSHSATEALLYPGCVVDVLASFRLPSSESKKGQAISTTLLRGIQVLAVEDKSVVSKDKKEKGPLQVDHRMRTRLTVTLMVDPRQAEALHLAAEHGKISLAMRNPLDKTPVDMDATVLSKGQLTTLGSVPTLGVFAAKKGARQLRGWPTRANDGTGPDEEDDVKALVALLSPEQENLNQDVLTEKPSWPVTVIRGHKVQEQEFDIQSGRGAALADAEK